MCRFDELATKSVPLRGPMNEEEVISIILAQTNQRLYSNQSRFGLAKYDGYPQTKAGEARLLTDIARNAPLLAELDRLNTAIPVNSCGMYSYTVCFRLSADQQCLVRSVIHPRFSREPQPEPYCYSLL